MVLARRGGGGSGTPGPRGPPGADGEGNAIVFFGGSAGTTPYTSTDNVNDIAINRNTFELWQVKAGADGAANYWLNRGTMRGADGAAGAAGAAGADGNKIFFYDDPSDLGPVPSHTPGSQVGDLAMDESGFRIWKKVSPTTWNHIGDLAGATGAAGADGARGSVWRGGMSAPQVLSSDRRFDHYIDGRNGDYYFFTEAGEWFKAGNLKGDQGATGATGSQGHAGATGDTGATGRGAVPSTFVTEGYPSHPTGSEAVSITAQNMVMAKKCGGLALSHDKTRVTVSDSKSYMVTMRLKSDKAIPSIRLVLSRQPGNAYAFNSSSFLAASTPPTDSDALICFEFGPAQMTHAGATSYDVSVEFHKPPGTSYSVYVPYIELTFYEISEGGGPAGLRGPTGDKGAQGDKGPQGDKGTVGDPGPTGTAAEVFGLWTMTGTGRTIRTSSADFGQILEREIKGNAAYFEVVPSNDRLKFKVAGTYEIWLSANIITSTATNNSNNLAQIYLRKYANPAGSAIPVNPATQTDASASDGPTTIQLRAWVDMPANGEIIPFLQLFNISSLTLSNPNCQLMARKVVTA